MEIVDTVVESATGPMWPVWAGVGIVIVVVLYMRRRKNKTSGGGGGKGGSGPPAQRK